MIVTKEDRLLESNLAEETNFKFKSTAKAFKILSSNLYKNKILAVIRELSCNAFDAHIAAGKKQIPFNIHLPTYIDQFFYVEDFGIGLAPEDVKELYVTFFDSTKQTSNDYVGALGLGSKSPFAYTTNFTVISYWQGKQYNFVCFINENGIPSITELGEPSDTSRENGIRVEFSVKSDDVYYFQQNAENFFKFWQNTLPNFVGEEINVKSLEKMVEGNGWFVFKGTRYDNFKGCYAIQGPVVYPIDKQSLKQQLSSQYDFIVSNNFCIEFPIGELDIAPSREELSYDDTTISNIIKRIQDVASSYVDNFLEQSIDNTLPFTLALHKFASKFNQFNELANFSQTSFYNILKSKNITQIDFAGKIYNLDDFVNETIEIDCKKFSNFHIQFFKYERSRKSDVLKKQNITQNLIYKVDDENKSTIIESKFVNKEQIDEQFEKFIIQKQSLSSINKTDYNVKTIFNFSFKYLKIDEKPLIIVDDLRNSSSSGIIRCYLLEKDVKAFVVKSSIKTLDINEIKTFIHDNINGSEIKLLSELEDFREKRPIVKCSTNCNKVIFSTFGNTKIVVKNLQFELKNHYLSIQKSKIDFKKDFAYYVFEKRGKFYFDEQCNKEINLKENDSKNVLDLFFALNFINSSINFIAIKPTQLSKISKNVNFVNLGSFINEKINSLKTNENIEILENLRTIEDVKFINWWKTSSRWNKESEQLKQKIFEFSDSYKDKSMFAAIINPYFSSSIDNLTIEDVLTEKLIYSNKNMLNDTALNVKISNQYPMFDFCNYPMYDKQDKFANFVLDYVKLVDNL